MRPCLAFLFLASTALAQINVPATTPPHEPIVATVDIDGDAQVLWEASTGVQIVQVGDNTSHIWAPPGRHTVSATVIGINWDTKRLSVKKHAATFTVGGPTPTPTPVDDPPGPLAVALGAGVDRLVVAAFFRDLADVVQLSTTIKTTGQFREAQRVAVATLKEVKRYPDQSPELNKQISDRIAAAVGLDDVQMDSSKRAALVAALRKIAEDF